MVNQATLDLLGYNGEELIGQPVGILFEEEEEEEEEEEVFSDRRLKKLLKEGNVRNLEGRKIPVVLSGSVMRNNEGKFEGIVCVVRDITERKRLEENWRKYEFIANTSGDFMTLINRDYEYEVVNEAYCLAHRRKREEIIGKTVADVWGGEKFKEVIKERLDRCFKGVVCYYS